MSRKSKARRQHLYPQVISVNLPERYIQREEIHCLDPIDVEMMPINRSMSQQESEKRRKVRKIFDEYDANGDGLISRRELQGLISDGQCRNIPYYISSQILLLSDTDNDGHLDFEEFFLMSQRNKWTLKNILMGYCQIVVPARHRSKGDAYVKRMTLCPPPLAMVLLSVIEIIVYSIDAIYFRINSELGAESGPAALIFIYDPKKRYQSWRFVSYMLVHSGFLGHLLLNFILQIFLGVPLEMVHQWWRVLLLFLAGVAAGSMGTSIVTPQVSLRGASGGVYALVASHIATIIMNWKEMKYAVVQFAIFFAFIFNEFGTSVYRYYTDSNPKADLFGQINMAHCFGAIAGLLVGIGLLRNLKVRRWERIVWLIGIILYFSLMIAGVVVHFIKPNYFPELKYN